MTPPDDTPPLLTLAEAAGHAPHSQDATGVRPVDDPEPGRRRRRRMPVLVTLALVAGFALLGLACVLAVAAGQDPPPWQIAAAGACGVGGVLAFFSFIPLQRRDVRRTLAERTGRDERGRVVDVEDLETADRLKWSAEDTAMLLAEPEENRVRLEGLVYSITVRGEDVVALARRPHPSGLPAATLVFEVAGVGAVGVALTDNGGVGRAIVRGLTLGLLMRRDPLLGELRRALGPARQGRGSP